MVRIFDIVKSFLYLYYLCIILLYLFLNKIHLRIISRISLSFLYIGHFLLRNLWNNKLQEAAGDFLRSVTHFLNTKQTALVLFLARQILISTTLYACLPLIDACLIAVVKRQKVFAAVRRTHAQFCAEFCICRRKNAETRSCDDSELKYALLRWHRILPGARAQQCE